MPELIRGFFCDFSTATVISTRGTLFTFYPDLDNISRSAYPWIDLNGIRGTVDYTGPTFHTSVEINNMSFLLLNFKNRMWADLSTQAATNAFVFIQNKT